MSRKSILISRRDFVRDPLTTFSGGSWTLPLSNLKDHNLDYFAKASDNNPTSTTFDCDLGAVRHIDVLFFQNLRLTVNATMRLRADTNPAFTAPVFDTGIIAAWPEDGAPMTYNQWGEFRLTSSYSQLLYTALALPRYFVMPAAVLARYIRFEASDTTAATPLQIGVFGAAEVWSPPYNMSYGRTVTYIDDSTISRSPGGSVFVTRRRVRQRHSYGIDVPQGEMWLRGFDQALVKGMSSPFVVVPSPDDTMNIEKQAIYGMYSSAPSFTNPYFGLWPMSFQIDQL